MAMGAGNVSHLQAQGNLADDPLGPGPTGALIGQVSALSDSWITLLGASAGLQFPNGLRVGGRGFAMTQSARVMSGNPLDLTFGYGGLTVAGVLSGPFRWDVLVGAGNIDLRLPDTDVEILSSNAFVTEVALSGLLPLDLPFAAEASLGYRWVEPGERLDDVPIGTLSGVFISASLRLP